ncbi:hypothetical protein FRB97_000665 [Tulasnella sp. 331]|nr:hypothetical protein FRB97_000665 [Tulasnella sp. 331]
MHAVFQTPELLHLVFKLLKKDDQVQFGCVCSSIWDVAIEHVWRDVPRLSCLLYLLGNALTTPKRGLIRLSRKLVDSDWIRLKMYAPFVKSLGLGSTYNHDNCPTDNATFSPYVFDAVMRYSHGKVILPNLGSLYLDRRGGAISTRIAQIIIGPALRVVDIRILSPGPSLSVLPTRPYDDILEVFTMLYTRCQDIEDLSLYVGRNPQYPGFCGSLASTIRTQKNLQCLSLHLPNVSTDLLQAIGQSKRLKEVALNCLRESVPQVAHGPPLSTVERLDIQGEAVPCSAILQDISAATLTALRLVVSTTHIDVAAFHLISQLSNLREINLCIHTQVLWEFFKPALSCSQLLEVDFMSTYIVLDADGSRVEEMARSWPALRKLDFGLVGRGGPQVTLMDLQCFATHCPRLNSLAIAVDVMPEGLPRENSRLVSLPSLKEVELKLSRSGNVEYASKVAFVIDDMWPNLEIGTTGWAVWGVFRTGRLPIEYDTWGKIWGVVSRRHEERGIAKLRDGQYYWGVDARRRYWGFGGRRRPEPLVNSPWQ